MIDSPFDEENDEDVALRRDVFDLKELEEATNRILDADDVPLGSLTEDDVDSIFVLMIAWSRRSSFESAVIVDRLLKRIVDDMRAGNPVVQVTTRMYQISIEAWGKSNSKGGADRAQQIHDAMIQAYLQTNNTNIQPDTKSFNAVFLAWLKSKDPSAAKKGEALLQNMLTDWNTSKCQPNVVTFNAILELYAKEDSKDAMRKAEKIFNSMESLGVQKNAYIYGALQNLYSRSKDAGGPSKAMALLQEMIDQDKGGDNAVRPNVVNYNAVLRAYSRSSDKGSAKQAVEMLGKMEQPVSEGGYDVSPDKISYAMTIVACSRCPDRLYGAKFAVDILERMEEKAKIEEERRRKLSAVSPPAVSVDLKCFNTVVTAISRTNHPRSVDRILQILSRMEEDYANAEGREDLRPNTRSWNAALNALARMKSKEAALRAESIMETMFELHNNGTHPCKPDHYSYAALLTAYQKLQTPEAARRAQDILHHMEELYYANILDEPPHVIHYTIVCNAWAKSNSSDSSRRCLELLSHMHKIDREGRFNVKPNLMTYNTCIDGLSRALQAEKAEQLLYHMLSLSRKGDSSVMPDSFSFDSVINTFLRSGMRDAGRRAESVLERGLEYAEEEGGNMLEIKSFTTILGYYGHQKQSRISDSPYRAEYVLNRLVALFQAGHKSLSPVVSCFTFVMDAYSMQGNREAGRVSENLLRTMIKLKRDYGSNDLEVNTGVMNCVLNAWECCASVNEDAGLRAERLLDLMEQKSFEGNANITPNARSYCKVIGAWTKSKAPNKVDRAFSIVRRFEKLVKDGIIDPTKIERPYTLIINACSSYLSNDQEVAIRYFNIAVDLMTKLMDELPKDGAQLKPTTYGCFFRTVRRLDIPESLKNKYLERVFKRCYETGRVNNFVFEQFKNATSDKQFRELISHAVLKLSNSQPNDKDFKRMVKLTDLPKEWKSNGHYSTNNTKNKNNYNNSSSKSKSNNMSYSKTTKAT